MNNLENELKKALNLIDSEWKIQNNYFDYKSKFIYKVGTVEEVRKYSVLNGINEDYALHRWYNFQTSIACENIFVEYGAVKEEDLKNKEIDIYIDNIPYDVKLTVYPKALNNRPYDLKTIE